MNKYWKYLLSSMVMALFLVAMMYAAAPSYSVEMTIGSVKVSTDGGRKWKDAYPGMKLASDDIIKTGGDSSCEVSIPGRGVLKIESTSKISINKMVGAVQKVKVSKGKVLFNIFKKSHKTTFKVETDVAVVAVRGTQFVVDYDGQEEVTTSVVEGKVSVKRQVTIPASLTSPEMEKFLEVDVSDKQEVTMTMTENEKLQDLIGKTRKNLGKLKKVLRSNQSTTEKSIRMMKNAQEVVDDMRSLDPDQSESATELDSIMDNYKKKKGYK